jgi:uncharacterized protein (DUF1810 family)
MIPEADDPFDLSRFVAAQARDYATALAEIRAGHKESHWMWFIFPQSRGLGSSAMALRYGIASREEVRAYLAHPLLGARLRECVEALLALPGEASADRIFGEIDAMKLRSCLTLFRAVAGAGSRFDQALTRFYRGEPDPHTIELLERQRGNSTP